MKIGIVLPSSRMYSSSSFLISSIFSPFRKIVSIAEKFNNGDLKLGSVHEIGGFTWNGDNLISFTSNNKYNFNWLYLFFDEKNYYFTWLISAEAESSNKDIMRYTFEIDYFYNDWNSFNLQIERSHFNILRDEEQREDKITILPNPFTKNGESLVNPALLQCSPKYITLSNGVYKEVDYAYGNIVKSSPCVYNLWLPKPPINTRIYIPGRFGFLFMSGANSKNWLVETKKEILKAILRRDGSDESGVYGLDKLNVIDDEIKKQKLDDFYISFSSDFHNDVTNKIVYLSIITPSVFIRSKISTTESKPYNTMEVLSVEVYNNTSHDEQWWLEDDRQYLRAMWSNILEGRIKELEFENVLTLESTKRTIRDIQQFLGGKIYYNTETLFKNYSLNINFETLDPDLDLSYNYHIRTKYKKFWLKPDFFKYKSMDFGLFDTIDKSFFFYRLNTSVNGEWQIEEINNNLGFQGIVDKENSVIKDQLHNLQNNLNQQQSYQNLINLIFSSSLGLSNFSGPLALANLGINITNAIMNQSRQNQIQYLIEAQKQVTEFQRGQKPDYRLGGVGYDNSFIIITKSRDEFQLNYDKLPPFIKNYGYSNNSAHMGFNVKRISLNHSFDLDSDYQCYLKCSNIDIVSRFKSETLKSQLLSGIYLTGFTSNEWIVGYNGELDINKLNRGDYNTETLDF